MIAPSRVSGARPLAMRRKKIIRLFHRKGAKDAKKIPSYFTAKAQRSQSKTTSPMLKHFIAG
jgi:hypothetical protein